MKFSVYVNRSLKTGRYYIGHCSDLAKRLKEHNEGKTRSTKSGIPWLIIKVEHYNTKSEAYKREKQIKSYKSGEAFKKIIKY